MKVINDFKIRALRGNVPDLAVAVVIGTFFGRIVLSLVNDLLLPPLGNVDRKCRFHDRRLCYFHAEQR